MLLLVNDVFSNIIDFTTIRQTDTVAVDAGYLSGKEILAIESKR